MMAAPRLGLCVPFLAAAALAACAGEKPSAQQPESHQAQPPPRDDGSSQLVRKLEDLKKPGANAVKDTQEAQSVLKAIEGAAQMQRDAGPPDH